MRGVAFLLLLLLLQACRNEPTFDERYEAAERAIREKAEAIDAELEKRARDAGDGSLGGGGQGATPTPSPAS